MILLALLALLPDTGLPPRGFDARRVGLDRVLAPLSGQTGGLAFAPDGGRLAVGCAAGVVLYDARLAEPVGRMDGTGSVVLSLAWSPDGTRLAGGAVDGGVLVWKAAVGAPVQVLPGHEAHVSSLAWSPDGTRLISGSLDGTVRAWDLRSGACLRVLTGADPSVMALRFEDEGAQVRAALGNGTLRLWDLDTGRERPAQPGVHGLLTSAVFLPDGRMATGNGSGDVRVRLPEPGSPERAFPSAEGGAAIGRLACTPDGRHLLAVTHAGGVRIWDAREGRLLASLASGAGVLEAIAVDPSGRCFVTTGQDRLVRVWRPLPGDAPRVRPRGLCGIHVEEDGAGAVVAAVLEGKPAAGRLQVGDRLRAVDGRAVKGRLDVVDLIGRRFAGDEILLLVERGGEERPVKVTLARRDED